MTPDISRRIAGEALGTALLLATVVGSGIMAAKLAGGNAAIALLGNTLPTGAMLVVLILIFGPLSGAHLNPAVTLSLAMRRVFPWRDVPAYFAAQFAGAILGTWLAHIMFDLSLFQFAATIRSGPGQWVSEAVASFGLIVTVIACSLQNPGATPYAVGLYITAAYWFTASTSFANPAVTVARSLTDTFAGILPASAPAFIVAQLLGASVAVLAARWFWPVDADRSARR